jgi:hypothetical protein
MHNSHLLLLLHELATAAAAAAVPAALPACWLASAVLQQWTQLEHPPVGRCLAAAAAVAAAVAAAAHETAAHAAVAAGCEWQHLQLLLLLLRPLQPWALHLLQQTPTHLLPVPL